MATEADKEQASAILSMMKTPGWAFLEASLVKTMQNMMPKALDESDEGRLHRAKVKAYQEILNFMYNKQAEAEAILEEPVEEHA